MAGLKLYTSNRIEALSSSLAELMRDDPLRDPLQAEIIIIQSRGMERWLSLELACRLGICAHIRFPFPIHFVYDVFRHTLGNLPETSPYDPAVLTWKIMYHRYCPVFNGEYSRIVLSVARRYTAMPGKFRQPFPTKITLYGKAIKHGRSLCFQEVCHEQWRNREKWCVDE